MLQQLTELTDQFASVKYGWDTESFSEPYNTESDHYDDCTVEVAESLSGNQMGQTTEGENIIFNRWTVSGQ